MKFINETEKDIAFKIEFLKEQIEDKNKKNLPVDWEKTRLEFYRHLWGELIWEKD